MAQLVLPELCEISWADVTILDPEIQWTYDVSRSRSKSRNTPFDGRAMKGAAVATIVGGRIVYRHPELERRQNELRQKTSLHSSTRAALR